MIKLSKVFAAAATVLLLTTTNAFDSQAKAETSNYNLQGTATVTYRTPIVVWAEPGAHPIHKYLPKYSSWRYFKITKTADGQQWYNLGGNQWVPAKYINYGLAPSLEKWRASGMFISYKVVTIQNNNGKGTYVTDIYGNSKGRLLPNGSRWKSYGFIDHGALMYNLGGDQWIYGIETR